MRKRALSTYRALHLLPPKGLIEAVDAFVGQEVFEQVAVNNKMPRGQAKRNQLPK